MKKHLFILLVLFSFSKIYSQCNVFYSIISPDGNYVYFSSDINDGNYQIFRANANDFTNTVQLTNISGVNNFYPSVSPDGSLIAFQSGDYNANSELYIMNNDGSNLQQLTSNTVYDGYPNFSPDGSKIVFDAWDTSDYPEVFTMNIDGTDHTQLTNLGGAEWQSAPIYSYDGSKIYFSKAYNADNHYIMMDLDGTNWVNITDSNSFGYMEWGLHFNSTGDKIIFQTTEWVGYNNGADIVIADPDGSNWEKITNSTAAKAYSVPSFHPTNNKLYYSFHWANGADTWSIHTMNLDGTNDTELSSCENLSVNDLPEKDKFVVYPNPVKDNLMISIEDDFILELYDPSGRLVLKSNKKQNSVSHLPSGLFILVIKNINNHILGYRKVIKE